jgi:hypothetical protein
MRIDKNDDSLMKHLALTAAMAVALYVVSFAWIEHRRTMRGPWQVQFQSDAAGQPSITFHEPALAISETVAFPGEKTAPNLDVRQQFADATTNVPFGRVIFQDPTFLPGTLTLGLFGHEVEALPRVLIIDKKEIAWTSNGRVEVSHPATNLPAPQSVSGSAGVPPGVPAAVFGVSPNTSPAPHPLSIVPRNGPLSNHY